MLRNVECSSMYQVNDLLKLTGPVTLLPVYFYVGELSLNSDSITSSSSSSSGCHIATHNTMLASSSSWWLSPLPSVLCLSILSYSYKLLLLYSDKLLFAISFKMQIIGRVNSCKAFLTL